MQNRFDIECQKLSKIEQNIRDIEKYCDINPFDFNDNDQHDNEFNLNEFLDIAENKNRTKSDRTPVFDVILDSQRENYPFILNGEYLNNDDGLFQVNSFYKDPIK